jgi:hypothetical protein
MHEKMVGHMMRHMASWKVMCPTMKGWGSNKTGVKSDEDGFRIGEMGFSWVARRFEKKSKHLTSRLRGPAFPGLWRRIGHMT